MDRHQQTSLDRRDDVSLVATNSAKTAAPAPGACFLPPFAPLSPVYSSPPTRHLTDITLPRRHLSSNLERAISLAICHRRRHATRCALPFHASRHSRIRDMSRHISIIMRRCVLYDTYSSYLPRAPSHLPLLSFRCLATFTSCHLLSHRTPPAPHCAPTRGGGDTAAPNCHLPLLR